LDSPLLVLQISHARFLKQSSHPFKDVNSMFSFKATSSAFCLHVVTSTGIVFLVCQIFSLQHRYAKLFQNLRVHQMLSIHLLNDLECIRN
jgi:hypothetical protein